MVQTLEEIIVSLPEDHVERRYARQLLDNMPDATAENFEEFVVELAKFGIEFQHQADTGLNFDFAYDPDGAPAGYELSFTVCTATGDCFAQTTHYIDPTELTSAATGVGPACAEQVWAEIAPRVEMMKRLKARTDNL